LEVSQAIKGLMAGKAVGPNSILTRVLRHLPKHAGSFLMKVFNAVLQRQYVSPAWKHACLGSILNLEKHPVLPSHCGPISLLNIAGSLFKKIPLTMVLCEVNECILLLDEQLRF
jgi:hypothetical protein